MPQANPTPQPSKQPTPILSVIGLVCGLGIIGAVTFMFYRAATCNVGLACIGNQVVGPVGLILLLFGIAWTYRGLKELGHQRFANLMLIILIIAAVIFFAVETIRSSTT